MKLKDLQSNTKFKFVSDENGNKNINTWELYITSDVDYHPVYQCVIPLSFSLEDYQNWEVEVY